MSTRKKGVCLYVWTKVKVHTVSLCTDSGSDSDNDVNARCKRAWSRVGYVLCLLSRVKGSCSIDSGSDSDVHVHDDVTEQKGLVPRRRVCSLFLNKGKSAVMYRQWIRKTVDPTQTYMLMSKLWERRVYAEVCALYEISLNYAHYLHIGGRLKGADP